MNSTVQFLIFKTFFGAQESQNEAIFRDVFGPCWVAHTASQLKMKMSLKMSAHMFMVWQWVITQQEDAEETNVKDKVSVYKMWL